MVYTSSQDSASLAEGKQVITACAVINRKTKTGYEIMVARRALTKKFLPGKYELPGGHVDFGETLIDGLKRELAEELGISITVGDIVGAFTYVNEVKRSHSLEIIYLAQLDGRSEPVLNPEDHSEILWVDESTIHLVEQENGSDDREYPYLIRALNMLNATIVVNPGN